MFGAFRPTNVNLGGLLWYVYLHASTAFVDNRFTHRKTPWKLSVTRKANARSRLKRVDAVIEAVRASGIECGALVRLPAISRGCPVTNFEISSQNRALELPKEHEMPARDKYTVFSPHVKGYRKGIHKVPKWTRVCSLQLSAARFNILIYFYDTADAEDKPKRFLISPHYALIYHVYYHQLDIILRTGRPELCLP